MELICASCKRRVTNAAGTTQFQCPQCLEHTIVRCSKCRKNATQYTCPKCNFTGPN